MFGDTHKASKLEGFHLWEDPKGNTKVGDEDQFPDHQSKETFRGIPWI